nr:SGNH hydrolase domain-containing protein [Marinicella sp. W31]MDC2877299.1 SGNH hydrolase domain-containing protein [Marinicella sp. W31]
MRKVVFVPLSVAAICYLAVVFAAGAPRDFRRSIPSLSVVSTEFGWSPRDLPTLGSQHDGGLTTGRRKLVVVGDSHADAISGAAMVAADAENMEFVTYNDCAFTLLTPVPNPDDCAFLKTVTNGDVVLFSALNVPRYVNQDGASFPEPQLDSDENIKLIENAREQLSALVRDLRKAGVGVIIRGPEPLFRYIPFRCADWYNRHNPICSNPTFVARTDLLDRLRPTQFSIEKIEEGVEGVIVFDVLDVLCPGESCYIFDDAGNPLFSDQDHLSGWGNELILPRLEESLQAALGTVG